MVDKSSIIQIPDKELVAIKKDFFVDGLILTTNVYLQIRSNHYILIGKKGTPSTISNYHAMTREDSILYIRTDEYDSVMSSNFSFTEKVINSDQVPIATKMKYINTLSDSVVEDLFKFGVGIDSFENIKKIGSFVLSSVKEIDCLADIMKQLDSLPHEMSKHAMATAYFSLMIADEMHITLKAALEKLVLGSLVHDIGLREIPREILAKPRLQWTEEELHYYESHPSRGVEILKGIPEISYDILLIVNEHHENALGLGFPRRIRDIKINPLARIVALADYVTDMMYGQTANTNAKDLDSIIDYIQNVMGQPFNKPAFFALKSLANKQNRINKFK